MSMEREKKMSWTFIGTLTGLRNYLKTVMRR